MRPRNLTADAGRRRTRAVRDAEPVAVEAMLRFIYTDTYPRKDQGDQDEGLDPVQVVELGVFYQIDELVAAASEDILEGVTADNVCQRGAVLKRHADHAALAGKLTQFREIVKKDDALFDALL